LLQGVSVAASAAKACIKVQLVEQEDFAAVQLQQPCFGTLPSHNRPTDSTTTDTALKLLDDLTWITE